MAYLGDESLKHFTTINTATLNVLGISLRNQLQISGADWIITARLFLNG